MHKIFTFIFLLFTVACAPTEFEKAQAPIIKEMKWLYTANPDKDFEKAVKIGDFRFIGIYGYRLAVPGVDIKCLDVRKDVNPIKGTTDAVLGYEHSKLIAIAGAYANYYNFRMRIYLEENNGFECGP